MPSYRLARITMPPPPLPHGRARVPPLSQPLLLAAVPNHRDQNHLAGDSSPLFAAGEPLCPKGSALLLPTVTMLRPAFVPCSSTVAGEQTTLLPSAKSWMKLLLCRRTTTPPCPVHLCVWPSCHGCLHAGRSTSCFLLGKAAPPKLRYLPDACCHISDSSKP
jgi:hypothetical protein